MVLPLQEPGMPLQLSLDEQGAGHPHPVPQLDPETCHSSGKTRDWVCLQARRERRRRAGIPELEP